MWTDWLVSGLIGVVVALVPFGIRWVVRYRRARALGGVYPLPGWRLTERHLSEDARVLVARVARASVRDVIQEWEELPVGLRQAIDALVLDRVSRHLVNTLRTAPMPPPPWEQNRNTGDANV